MMKVFVSSGLALLIMGILQTVAIAQGWCNVCKGPCRLANRSTPSNSATTSSNGAKSALAAKGFKGAGFGSGLGGGFASNDSKGGVTGGATKNGSQTGGGVASKTQPAGAAAGSAGKMTMAQWEKWMIDHPLSTMPPPSSGKTLPQALSGSSGKGLSPQQQLDTQMAAMRAMAEQMQKRAAERAATGRAILEKMDADRKAANAERAQSTQRALERMREGNASNIQQQRELQDSINKAVFEIFSGKNPASSVQQTPGDSGFDIFSDRNPAPGARITVRQTSKDSDSNSASSSGSSSSANNTPATRRAPGVPSGSNSGSSSSESSDRPGAKEHESQLGHLAEHLLAEAALEAALEAAKHGIEHFGLASAAVAVKITGAISYLNPVILADGTMPPPKFQPPPFHFPEYQNNLNESTKYKIQQMLKNPNQPVIGPLQ